MRSFPVFMALTLAVALPCGLSDPGGGWVESRVSTCSRPGYWVSSYDCTKFYRCVDHSTEDGTLLVRYDFDCPHGTVFDEVSKVCVHNKDGICGGWGWGPPAVLPPQRRPYYVVATVPKGGWSRKPIRLGWKPATVIVEDSKDGWGWSPPSPSSNYWKFTPSSSYVVVYDDDRSKRSSDLL